MRDREPTDPHEAVAGKGADHLGRAVLASDRPWIIPRTCLITPPAAGATALRPDVVLLDETGLALEPLWQREPILTSGQAIRLVVEVVSTNWQDDYARKVEEYALLGIPEYWIVDYRGLGGIAFIGKPKQPTFTLCVLQGDQYHCQSYRSPDPITSPLFPKLSLRLVDLLPRPPMP